MGHHFTKATDRTVAWCSTCGRQTDHAVSGGRLGHCLEHQAQELTKGQQRRRERAAIPKSGELFPH